MAHVPDTDASAAQTTAIVAELPVGENFTCAYDGLLRLPELPQPPVLAKFKVGVMVCPRLVIEVEKENFPWFTMAVHTFAAILLGINPHSTATFPTKATGIPDFWQGSTALPDEGSIGPPGLIANTRSGDVTGRDTGMETGAFTGTLLAQLFVGRQVVLPLPTSAGAMQHT